MHGWVNGMDWVVSRRLPRGRPSCRRRVRESRYVLERAVAVGGTSPGAGVGHYSGGASVVKRTRGVGHYLLAVLLLVLLFAYAVIFSFFFHFLGAL